MMLFVFLDALLLIIKKPRVKFEEDTFPFLNPTDHYFPSEILFSTPSSIHIDFDEYSSTLQPTVANAPTNLAQTFPFIPYCSSVWAILSAWPISLSFTKQLITLPSCWPSSSPTFIRFLF